MTDSFTDDVSLAPPTNTSAEWSVLSNMMLEPKSIPQIISLALEARDFSTPDGRLIYQQVIDRHYQSKSVDPLVVGELCREDLSMYWSADPSSVGELMRRRVDLAKGAGSIAEHGEIVKRLSKSRQIMDVARKALRECAAGDTPDEVGDRLSTDTLQITAGQARRYELMDWNEAGVEYGKRLAGMIRAHQQGVDIGVKTGLAFIDNATAGIAPGELCFIAGDPGAGKTSVSFALMEGFARRQLSRAPEHRMATLFLCLEMPLLQSMARWVQRITDIPGSALREGSLTRRDWAQFQQEWKMREGLPLVFNFASNMKQSQMRTLVAEAIRKYNVGFVVIDHFRMFDTDRYHSNPNVEDESKVRFLKESLAQDLDVAVMCLAHTVKRGDREGKSARPRLSDLRGSGQVAAHADFVGFLYRQWKEASEESAQAMLMNKTEMEMYWEKNRFGSEDPIPLTFDPLTMLVADRAAY
jgi:replicative DNA helicase